MTHLHNRVLFDGKYHQRESFKADHERFFYPLVKVLEYLCIIFYFVYILLVT